MVYPHGGFLNWGYPNSWLVYFRENPINMDGLGAPLFQETAKYQQLRLV